MTCSAVIDKASPFVVNILPFTSVIASNHNSLVCNLLLYLKKKAKVKASQFAFRPSASLNCVWGALEGLDVCRRQVRVTPVKRITFLNG